MQYVAFNLKKIVLYDSSFEKPEVYAENTSGSVRTRTVHE